MFGFLSDIEQLTSNDVRSGDSLAGDIEMLANKNNAVIPAHALRVHMQTLLHVLATQLLPGPTSTLLLYSLLQMHPSFLDMIKSSSYSEAILTKCLEGLLEACGKRRKGISLYSMRS